MHPRKNDAPCRFEARFARNKTQRMYSKKNSARMASRNASSTYYPLGATQVSVRLVLVEGSVARMASRNESSTYYRLGATQVSVRLVLAEGSVGSSKRPIGVASQVLRFSVQ